LGNIFETGELAEDSVSCILEHIGEDGITYGTKYYNLDATIAFGYRVNSYPATQFRFWATRTLRKFIVKGFVLDDARPAGFNQHQHNRPHEQTNLPG
jgi:hypothetical protein